MLVRACFLLFFLACWCTCYHMTWGPVYNSFDQKYDDLQPQDIMVDYINRLGLYLLNVHNEDNFHNNIALSPYGAVSVLIALAEGLKGDAALEIYRASHIPHDLTIIRIGLRDIHRHLKSYFIPREGFLAGLTLSHENVTLSTSYERILKFYGYDLGSFRGVKTPSGVSSTIVPEITPEAEARTEPRTTPRGVTEIPRVSEAPTEIPRVTEAATEIPRVTEAATEIRRVSEAATETPRVPEAATEILRVTEAVTQIPRVTETAVTSAVVTEIAHATEAAVTGVVTENPRVTDAAVTIPVVEITTPLVTETSMREETTAKTPVTIPVVEVTSELIQVSSTATEMQSDLEDATASVTPSLGTESVSLTTESEAELITTTATPETTSVTAPVEPLQAVRTMSSANLTSRKSNITGTIKMITAINIQTKTKMVNNDELLDKNAKRNQRSIIDYLIARYYDDYYIPKKHNFPKFRPRIPFFIDGIHRIDRAHFMTYDTILPFFYMPNLDALALSFPLDSVHYYLLLILPLRDDGIDDLICDLKRNPDLKYIIRNMKYTRVKAVIPSFTLRGHVNLTPTLQRLGIQKIFEPQHADFTPMTNNKDVYVTNIEQAITVTIRNYVDLGVAADHGELHRYGPVEFKADHPFLYFVMDAQMHVALMAGKIIDPLNSRIR